MNLTEFTARVDDLAAHCTPEQLLTFLHEIARKLPEDFRYSFYTSLRDISENHSNKQKQSPKTDSEEWDPGEEVDTALSFLEDVQNGDCTLFAELNESYDDWYGDGEEFLYSDPADILITLYDICTLLQKCVKFNELSSAADLGDALFSLDISVNAGDYDHEAMSVSEAAEALHVELPLRNTLLDTLYAIYCTEESPALSIYNLISEAGINGLSLEELLQHAPQELKGFPAFLQNWIQLLATETGWKASALYQEALNLLPSAEDQVPWLQANASTHPESYLHLLQRSDLPQDFRFRQGQDAVNRIAPALCIRADIALETASLAISLGMPAETAETYRLAAFVSRPSGENYLRVYLNCTDPVHGRKQLNAAATSFIQSEAANSYFDPDWSRSNPLAENKPGRNRQLVLRFLQGDFEGVLRDGVSKPEPLGWSFTFMKTGLSLFLTALYQRNRLPNAIQKLYATVSDTLDFNEERYHQGLGEDNHPTFVQVYQGWKNTLVWQPDFRQNVLDHIAQLLKARVAAITREGHRKIYGECALYIAALGDVLESLGNAGARRQLLSSYKAAYPRHSRLQAELNAYL